MYPGGETVFFKKISRSRKAKRGGELLYSMYQCEYCSASFPTLDSKEGGVSVSLRVVDPYHSGQIMYLPPLFS